MFVGSINRYMRCVLEAAAKQWKGRTVYVACSGNFTVERILSRCGVGAIHSNDVSIYSCALGWYLAGIPYRYTIREQEFSFIEPYLDPGPATVATLLLLGEMLKFGSQNAYAKRIAAEYRRKWPELHHKSSQKIAKAIASFKIASYFAGDCREFLANADKDAVCISFPPTYEGGYERLFKRLEEIIDWPRPHYDLFSPEDFEQFSQTVRSFEHWMISSDLPQEDLTDSHVATVQTSMTSKPVFMYSSQAPARLATAHQVLGRNPWAPRTDEAAGPIELVKIDGKTMNAIRSVYLNPKIMPVMPERNFAVLSAGKLVGAFGLSQPRGPLPCDVYLMADFAVRPSPHKRLSKLILACVMSTEVQTDLEQWLCGRIRRVGTTAFEALSFSDAPDLVIVSHCLAPS